MAQISGYSGFSKIVYPALPPSPITPVLSSTSGGALADRNYFVQTTYVTTPGETLTSGEASLPVPANSLLVVQSPSQIALPFVTSGYNVYVGTGSGTESLQNSSPIPIGTDWTEPTSGLVTGAAPPASWTATALLFKHPATKIPAYKYDAVRHDNVASSGVYEAIYERTDEFIEFDMEWVDNDTDLQNWNSFITYGLQGGTLSFYQDIHVDSFRNCTLWDSKWDAKWKTFGRYTFKIVLRVLAGFGSAPISGTTTQLGLVNFADAIVPSGPIDGVNVAFTLPSAPTPAASLQLFLNGVEQTQGNDYTLSTTVISFVAAPSVGSSIITFYRY